MSEFISAVEASILTPVSASTIKRFIREVVDDPSHSSRDKIQPSVAELKRAQEAGEPYRWTIEKEFAIEKFCAADAKKGSSENAPSEMVLDILRTQLEAKDAQIRTLETQLDRKDDQIKRQDERMQETHILMQDLQKRFGLTAPTPETITVNEDAPEKSSKKSEPKTTTKPKTKAKKSQRALFGGLFRRAK